MCTSGYPAKTDISLKCTRLGNIIGIRTERSLDWTFPTPGPNNRRETYPRGIIGIFADKVVRKGAEINPGKAGRFLTGPDGLQGELSPRRERLNPGSRAQPASGRAWEADLNLPSPDPGLMVEGRVALNSKPWWG